MILIALGANLPSRIGPPIDTLRAALDVLDGEGVRPVKLSKFYATPAWPVPTDPEYVNAVARVETTLDPQALIVCLHAVESLFGRERNGKNAPRTLDLDILDYDGRIQDTVPILPHPRLEKRAFVLIPLAEIAPDWRHPVSGQRAHELVNMLTAEEREAVRPIEV